SPPSATSAETTGAAASRSCGDGRAEGSDSDELFSTLTTSSAAAARPGPHTHTERHAGAGAGAAAVRGASASAAYAIRHASAHDEHAAVCSTIARVRSGTDSPRTASQI